MITEIQRYKIKGQIGQGAMADVYEAYDPRIDRQLALKVLREEHRVDGEYMVRFLREAKAVGNLTHPNIVTVYDVDEFNNRPFIVMEFLEGTPLNEIIKRGTRLGIDNILEITFQLASALHYAHEKGIVHRDVKPSNIICADSLNSAKITDFGIAHIDDSDLTHQTRVGDVIGTPQYMSPEQVSGTIVDRRSDLFSLGVILYQLLTGERPFTGDSITSLMYQITHVDPKPIQSLNPEVPPALAGIVERLLNKNPQQRFQTGKDLMDAIRTVKNLSRDTPAQGSQHRFPIPLKWSAFMAVIFSISMVATISLVMQKQFQAMTNQMLEYGDSIVKFVAAESAVQVLSEDWISIELFVREARNQQDFDYLTIVDHKGIVRGSSVTKDVGKSYTPRSNDQSDYNMNIVDFMQNIFSSEIKVTNFEAPIMFQNKKIGSVYLGIEQKSVQKITELTLYMMTVLLIINLLVVSVFSYILGKYFSASLSTLNAAMNDIKQGKTHSRIEVTRKDEVGDLYMSFNDMADQLQRKAVKSKAQRTNQPFSPDPSQESTKLGSKFTLE
ncbi:MAG: protein kinase [Gammaproteobacteria bacterium]|nr:protein kinase [Gammaproteobacteria bacterium]MDH5802419.1 protein kinase [Gammaproteobacteria bacterium]